MSQVSGSEAATDSIWNDPTYSYAAEVSFEIVPWHIE